MFEKLLEVLFDADGVQARPTYIYLGWWITPTDRKLDAHGKNEHWMIVRDHPGWFGLNAKDPIFKTERTHKFTQMAIDAGAIRVAKTPDAYFIDSNEISKKNVDRLWFAFSDLDTKELIWDCKVPFRGKSLWKGTLDELEPLIENKLVESHSHSKCMRCDMKPTKEVLWANGHGHAWFCDHCFKEWSTEGDGRGDLCGVKPITDGKAAKKFADNKNPKIREAKTDRELFESLRKLNEEDLFPNATPEDVKQRKTERDAKEEALYNSFNIGDKVKIAWLERTFGSEVGKVVSKGEDYVPGYKYAIYVEFDKPSLRLKLNHKELIFAPEELIKVSESRVNEEDLFPNASPEEVEKRKEEAKRKEEEELARRWKEGPIDIHLLFDTLVAPQGKSETVEGELVRAISKVGYRYNNDGDYFYRGYGKETAGPAARFLKAKANQLGIPELSKALTFMSSRRETEAEQFENGPYKVGLEAAIKAVVDYVVSKNRQFTPNTEDMHDY